MPLDAIKGFFDPSVQFGLQFETVTRRRRRGRRKSHRGAAPRRRPRSRSASRREPEPPAAIGPAEPAKTGRRRSRTRPSPRCVAERTRSPSPTSRRRRRSRAARPVPEEVVHHPAKSWTPVFAMSDRCAGSHLSASLAIRIGSPCIGRKRHAGERHHLRALDQRQPEAPRDHGERQQRLLHGERHADADARARAERQIGKARDLRAVLRREALRHEHLGVGPQLAVPVQHPRRDDDARAGRRPRPRRAGRARRASRLMNGTGG